MSVDEIIGCSGPAEEVYKPVTILAVSVPFPISFMRNALEIRRLVEEHMSDDQVASYFPEGTAVAIGTVFSPDYVGDAYSYNVWHGGYVGIGGGWHEPASAEDDMEVFKRFPSCVLLIHETFLPRLQQMAEAVGSTVWHVPFEHSDLDRLM